jgi:type I restriction enzyme M protein
MPKSRPRSAVATAHFGKNGQVLEDADLPVSLTEAWKEDGANADQPFPSYARLLKKRGTKAAESRYSWTVDFAGRRKQAREEMKPFQEEAERAKAEAVALKEKLKAIKTNGVDPEKIEKLETCIRDEEKAARDAQAKVDAIDATVFDLKAVNPNAVVKVDERTPEEVIGSIEDQGKIVAQSLSTLRRLLSNGMG